MVIMAGQCAKQGCDSDLQDRLVLARRAARKVIARAEKGRCERGIKRIVPVWEAGHVRVVTFGAPSSSSLALWSEHQIPPWCCGYLSLAIIGRIGRLGVTMGIGARNRGICSCGWRLLVELKKFGMEVF